MRRASSPLTTTVHRCCGCPYKDDQDRNSLKPKSTEGSKFGTDQGVAETDAAFEPSNTRPEEEKEAAGNENEGNPLAVSGANQKKSVPLGDKGGPTMRGTTKNEGDEKASGGGSPEKKGKPPAI